MEGMKPGTILQTRGGSLFEYVREGCVDPGWHGCTREHPITVIGLDSKGKRRFGDLTVCYEADQLTPAEGWT